jgi:hypothetical protein
MENMDGKLDRDGQRIENPVPGNPGSGPNEHEVTEIARARAHRYAIEAGEIEVWRDQWDR